MDATATAGTGTNQAAETLVDALWAAPDPNAPFTILGRAGLSETKAHKELLEEADARASGLAARGIGLGERVGLVAHASFDFVVGCLAVWRAGAALVPLAAPARGESRASWASTANNWLSKARASLVIAGAGDPTFDCPVAVVDGQDLATRSSSPPPGGEPKPDDVAVIYFSSGSTAAPKGVVLSHGALAAQLDGRRDLGVVDDHHELRTAPLHFSGGLMLSVAYPIALGWAVTLMPTRILIEDPASWLLAISRSRVTHAGGANFAFALATREIRRGLPEPVDLSCWQEASVGAGESPDHGTIVRFVDAAQPLGLRPGALRAAYALTETGLVSAVTPGSGLRFETLDRSALAGEAVVVPQETEGSATFVSSGRLVPRVELRVVSAEGDDLPERRVGELLVRSPFSMEGYLDDPKATDDAMVDGWFKTGDLGYMSGGELFVTGRLKDVIIVHGQNFYAEDIERVARAAIGSEDGNCAAFGVRAESTEALVVAVETQTSTGEMAERLRKEIARTVWSVTGLAVKDVVLVEPQVLPTTATGKLKRSLIKERYESGTLSATDVQGDG